LLPPYARFFSISSSSIDQPTYSSMRNMLRQKLRIPITSLLPFLVSMPSWMTQQLRIFQTQKATSCFQTPLHHRFSPLSCIGNAATSTPQPEAAGQYVSSIVPLAVSQSSRVFDLVAVALFAGRYSLIFAYPYDWLRPPEEAECGGSSRRGGSANIIALTRILPSPSY
jgi:hypothetical protein